MHLTPYSSVHSLSHTSSFLAQVHAQNAQCPKTNPGVEPFEFQPVTHDPFFVIGNLSRGTLLHKGITLGWSAVSKVASFVYSRLPSFALSGAAASACPPIACALPPGPYKKSCEDIRVTELPGQGECQVTAKCKTIYQGLPPQPTSTTYPIANPPAALDNQNATLVPTKAAEIVTIDSTGKPAVVDPKVVSSNPAVPAFQRMADATGGVSSHLPTPSSMGPLVEHLVGHILKGVKPNEPVDIAFVVDTTGSMSGYIAQVKLSLHMFLEEAQQRTQKNGNTIRFALVQYRDKSSVDAFVTKVEAPFTTDADVLNANINRLIAEGGGPDTPEAVYDGLLTAKNDLAWAPNAKRTVILIGDAAPKPRTADGKYGEADVLDQFTASDTQIAVYPIFSQT